MTQRKPTQVTFSGSCEEPNHATRGFANLQVRKVAGGVEFDPHVTGTCTFVLRGAELTKLVAQLTRWL